MQPLHRNTAQAAQNTLQCINSTLGAGTDSIAAIVAQSKRDDCAKDSSEVSNSLQIEAPAPLPPTPRRRDDILIQSSHNNARPSKHKANTIHKAIGKFTIRVIS